MKSPQISLSQRHKMLLGIATPPTLLRQNYMLRVALAIVLLLPWIAVLLGFWESWRTFAIGDSISIPLWAWAMAVIEPIIAVLLARCLANRLILQYYLRKYSHHE